MNITKALLLLLSFLLFTKVSAQDTSPTSKIYQLREYKLAPKHKDVFYSNFKNRTVPVMESYGFDILCTWTNNNDCYYLLQWDNLNVMHSQWELFKADQEWIEQKTQIQQKYGNIVIDINEQVLTSMDFQDRKSVITNNGFPIFNIGNIKCFALSDGFVSLPTQPSIAPHISKEIVSKELEENFRNDSITNYPINIFWYRRLGRCII